MQKTKKSANRLLALLLSIMMLVSMLPLSVFAEETTGAAADAVVTLTVSNRGVLASLMERLDALTAEQQKLVTNVDKLLDAQAQLAALKNPETGSDVPASAIILGATALCITAISLRRRRK